MDDKKVNLILSLFEEEYGNAECTLDYVNPLHLMIATQLAAQCTDARVNMVTPALYARYNTAEDFMNADREVLEDLIRSTGFFRNKARNIIACCTMLVNEYGGEVPKNMDDLLKLPGVGRKTANLVLGDAFGIPGIVVDTHAGRLARRIGFTKEKDPAKVERDLMKVIPKDKWIILGHWFVAHGRALCNARNPKCESCPIAPLCDYYQAL
ncbi:MAG: endonuclease III [Clostridia bacterium]|nr:endonuclease III [Clostridia bacterium]